MITFGDIGILQGGTRVIRGNMLSYFLGLRE